jgi:hypothetical protein
MIKLSTDQKNIIKILRKYDCIIMHNNWVTGGHGIRFNGKSIEALKRRGILQSGSLTELGKNISLE